MKPYTHAVIHHHHPSSTTCHAIASCYKLLSPSSASSSVRDTSYNRLNSLTMGKKKSNNNNNENKNSNEAAADEKGGGNDSEKKNPKKEEKNSSVTVVLKVDMHCEGCASKIVKCARSFEGVETVKAEVASNKITIVGAVDPSKIRDKLDQKTRKNIDLISPLPKKDNNASKEKEKTKEREQAKQDNKPKEDKKPKEAPVTTAVFKLGLHCQGCIQKIEKIVNKTKGVIEMSVDRGKDLVTVRGTMDAKALSEALKERLKRPVEIVPPKKEKSDDDKVEANGNGGGKKKKGGDGGDGGGGGKIEGGKMEYLRPVGFAGPGYGYGNQIPGGYGYEFGYPVGVGGYNQYQQPPGGVHAPQLFSDENPNACAVM